jgi:tRNA C32,U32 (ribose-2'-O)-methylase TrmJ
MSVAITLHEINMVMEEKDEETTKPIELASWKMQQQAFDALKSSLEEIHFLFGPKADALFNGIKTMIARSKPTTQEMKWLIGLNRQLTWYKAKIRDQN